MNSGSKPDHQSSVGALVSWGDVAICSPGPSKRDDKKGDARQKPLGMAPPTPRVSAPAPAGRLAHRRCSPASPTPAFTDPEAWAMLTHTGAQTAACGASWAPPGGARPPAPGPRLRARAGSHTRTAARSAGAEAAGPWLPEKGVTDETRRPLGRAGGRPLCAQEAHPQLLCPRHAPCGHAARLPQTPPGKPPLKTPQDAAAARSAVPGRSLRSRACGRKSRPHGRRRHLIRCHKCSVRRESMG